MPLNELCTNTTKFGALSLPAGRVGITWAANRPMSPWLLRHHERLQSARLDEAHSRPLAVPEDGHAPAIGVNAVDVGLVRTDHPVDVDQALVAALRSDLLGAELGAIDEAF
jgi:hypothetical protein